MSDFAELIARVEFTKGPWREPPFLAIWLCIIADNILHVICNALALFYFG